jgi:hypothetical protein
MGLVPRQRALCRGFLVLSIPLFAIPVALAGQGVIAGTVVQDSIRAPLPGVQILVEGSGAQTVSGRSGQYLLTGLPYGPGSVLFRAVGFRPVRRGVILLRGDTARIDVVMTRDDVPQELPPLRVNAPPEPRSMGIRDRFEERRRLGFGKFLDSTTLRANDNKRVVDLLRGIPGIIFVRIMPLCSSGRTPRCGTPELRAVGSRARGGCYASIFVDGIVYYRSQEEGGGHPDPPDWNREFHVSEFEAVEVYRSAAELPIEFGGASSQCGVIALWTRRGSH